MRVLLVEDEVQLAEVITDGLAEHGVTADVEHDEADSLDAGADDFLSKPFSFVVLLARLRALARRASVARPVVLQAGDLAFDVAASSVRRGATEIGLSRREMDVLEVLMRSDGAPVAKREIFNRVWGFDAEVDSNRPSL